MSQKPTHVAKPTLAGTSSKTRKRNVVNAYEPQEFLEIIHPCLVKESGLADLAVDLDALEMNGSPLDLKRYGDVFWEFFLTGGVVAAGGEVGCEGFDRNVKAVFHAADAKALTALVEGALGLLQRKTFMRPVLEDSFGRMSLFIGSFLPEQVERLALFIGEFHARSTQLQATTYLTKLAGADRLVESGQAAAFAVKSLKVFREGSSLDKVVGCLKLAKCEDSLSELLPSKKRGPLDVYEYFASAGLEDLAKFIQEVSLKHVAAEITSLMTAETACSEVASTFKSHVAGLNIPNSSAISMLYTAIVGSIQWHKRTEQHAAQFLSHWKLYGRILTPYANTNRIQIDLMNRLQVECSERSSLSKCFVQIVQLLYQVDVLGEDAVVKYAKGGQGVATMNKGRTDMVAQLQPFLDWLNEAEEDDDEE